VSKSNSFYWHDYETFGTDPRRDWPSQFAGIRTDSNLEVIGKPLMVYCKPPNDCLPQPEACMITGISPQKALAEGLLEKDFIAAIHQEMATPNTCVTGYNSIRFDDEVTRNSLYRNFYDPYQREYMNGNSRWDLIDLVRMTHALRPDGIIWPKNENGDTSFRLELLTQSNEIGHESAHDALSDVIATIEMAKLIKQKQERLFNYAFDNRKKDKAFDLLNLHKKEIVIHVSSKYPASQNCLALVLPICQDPVNSNGTVVCDLSKDPTHLLEESVDQIRAKLFTNTQALPEGTQRPPIKTVHANKCPALAPFKVLRDQDIERLELNISSAQSHQALLLKHQKELTVKIQKVLKEHQFEAINDPDLMIYSGGFFSRDDKTKMQRLCNMDAEALKKAQENYNFDDSRIAEMLFRYRARNFNKSLNNDEQKTWNEFRASKFKGEQESTSLSFQDFDKIVVKLKDKHQEQPEKIKLLNELIEYREQLL
jgi:exodeoxyribonuclease-1